MIRRQVDNNSILEVKGLGERGLELIAGSSLLEKSEALHEEKNGINSKHSVTLITSWDQR